MLSQVVGEKGNVRQPERGSGGIPARNVAAADPRTTLIIHKTDWREGR
jgi:hypothetical protein